MLIGIGGVAVTKFAGGTGPFTPDKVSGLKLWLKADAGITKDGSNLVSAWADQSGQGNNFSQSTGGAKPLYTASAQNGLPAIVFDGSSDYMTSAAFTLGPWTCFAVCSNNWATPAYGGLWRHDFGPYAGRGIITTASTVLGWNASEFVCTGNGYFDTQSPRAIGPWGSLSNGTYQLISAGCGASGSFVNVNKAAVTRSVSNASVTPGSFVAAIGTFEATYNINFWNGGIGELIIYDSVLSSGDIASVETYLKTRWATP